jgi:sterol desaturase/sphingolipid hydroxylase (fatty acid hydroxylase superfamily)
MSTVDLLGLLVPVSFGLLLGLEALFPAQRLPPKKGHRTLGWACLVVMALIGTFLPLLVPEAWVARFRLMDLSLISTPLGFAVGWATYTLIGYLWHRAVHASSWLWRGFHQLHHAPSRLDVASATIFHPTEVVSYTIITFATTVLLLGLSAEAGAWVGFFAAFVSFFQHANIKTPRVLGYLVQRPEAHSLHHHVDGPAGNFSDFPLWDIIFGSFINPGDFNERVGFRGTAGQRWGAMLLFVDVNQRGAGPGLVEDGRDLVAPQNA